MSDDVQVVQVRMRDETLSQVDRLKAIVGCPGRSEAVRRAVGITDILINAIVKGERVILERPDGKQTQILITGLNA